MSCYRTRSSRLWCCPVPKNIAVVTVQSRTWRTISPRQLRRWVEQGRLLQVQPASSICSAAPVTARTWWHRQAECFLLWRLCRPAIQQLQQTGQLVRKSVWQQQQFQYLESAGNTAAMSSSWTAVGIWTCLGYRRAATQLWSQTSEPNNSTNNYISITTSQPLNQLIILLVYSVPLSHTVSLSLN